MKGTTIAVEELAPGRTAAARIVDGRLDDLLIDPEPGDATPPPGAIYRAMLARPMKGTGGAIVDLGGGATGFLRDMKGLRAGRPIIVQVSTWAEPGKAPPVTTRILLKNRHAILTPGAPGINLSRGLGPGDRERLSEIAARAMEGASEDCGLILRTAVADASDDDISGAIAEVRALYARVLQRAAEPHPARLVPAATAAAEALREWPEALQAAGAPRPGAFADHGVWEAIDALRNPLVPLANGAGILIEPTRALVAIDVNTGSDTSPAAALKANHAAVRELPRQLRLRGLGGQIVIDFAPLSRKDRPMIEDALKAALRSDGIETTAAGWTPLGHLEILRKRARRPLTELLPA